MRRLNIVLLSTSLLLGACDKPISEGTHEIVTESRFTTSDINNTSHDFSAHWLTPQLLLLPENNQASNYSLINLPTKHSSEMSSGNSIQSLALTETTLPKDIATTFPI
jgi:hypothetical protein